MSKLNRDVLYLIFKELHNDKYTLHSCLLVNKTWCEVAIPILWRNPWKYLNYSKGKFLLDVIISHLSDESMKNIKSQGIDFTINSYKKPSFNYINFFKHLNLNAIKELVKRSEMLIIYNEIIRLFINVNTKFTHLYIPQKFDYQLHLIPEAKHCFSNIEFIRCYTNINDSGLAGLIEICKSVKELELIINKNDNNYGVTRLIETQKSLFNVHYIIFRSTDNVSFHTALETSLIKHANTIQHFKITNQPGTYFLSCFINLKSLELDGYFGVTWYCLKNLSLPFLQILKVNNDYPVIFLEGIIESTSGYLSEIAINRISYDDPNSKILVQTIYTKCPKLKYLKLEFKNNNILELEKLLINCQYLDGLFIIGIFGFDWYRCFEILTRSSPINLFKFKFNYSTHIGCLKLFFDDWKVKCPDRPMKLQLIDEKRRPISEENKNLIETYKAEGIIKKFSNHLYNEDFEWL
ncbi:uncharacterized protein OCT59_025599 [Rhizophagus irregularis]|uniref:F-box domain-containing protein n=2 Tax=Rhizophagus irregularis TaxID=588596 RepID=A0A2N1NFT4_9GLOM|nr:hypothetical protein GLOIN_2v1867142 [Rhizophagus irregularis DAOM 181602=DAOM 197198]PKK69534.1 hypothetical protein RhiirC2_780884 [Rhizophagus irregularis]PKK72731.1 hypothetical protein RhiirC2_848189 [Rhizophagus irregularis]POG82813.1 hypothetical protein GLOIN_2v1867142 [Rhizophagus irregularis DAOM 181602=DAOM 197198]UZO05240.1 hypothetical protein OCT59_025599 [Rhizophagus irregularis]GBC11261.1 hypothetical protein GLOIN_2v1867142 [Rhizophagus irregularis DAOM 181602=DAOM 197198]|eukprot:XP_025189679.1 hypothetical protein GLOIN_2v1867142 [Rhizophagus irregularis DAOM 181602=DAOM 197198]